MKKFVSALLIFVMAFGTVNVFAEENSDYTISESDNNVDGYITEDMVMVPLRKIIEASGQKIQIVWDNDEKSVTIYMGKRISKITIGAENMVLNGTEIPVAVPAEITDERIFISLSDLALVFGIKDDRIKWDNESKTAIINYQGEE